MAAIKPAVWPPGEGVQRLRMGILVSPPIEENLGRPRRFVLAVFDGHEHEIGSGADPYAAKTNLESAHEIEVIHEDGFLVEMPVSLGVFEYQDAIVGILLRPAQGIRIRLGYPEPAAIVEAEGDRLADVRLTSN